MIYVTGDLHGDFERFSAKALRKLKKGDTLICCGDFGFLWEGGKAEERALKKIGRFPFTTLFVDGAHENHEALQALPVTEYAGAAAHQLGKRLYHLLRGGILELEGKRIFVFGGGESSDRDLREENRSWWYQELPTVEEIAAGRQALEEKGNLVDAVITHEAPGKIRRFLSMDDREYHYLNAFLDEINQKAAFSQWYFGFFHLDKKITPLHTAVYREVIPLYQKEKKRRGKKTSLPEQQPEGPIETEEPSSPSPKTEELPEA